MKQLLVFLFLLCAASVSAQDVIVKKDGSTIVCRVVELTSTEITYKKWSYLNGSNYVMNRADASAINYENGKKVNLSEATNLYTPNNQNDGNRQVNDNTLLNIDYATQNPHALKKAKVLKTTGWIVGAISVCIGTPLLIKGFSSNKGSSHDFWTYGGIGAGCYVLGAICTYSCVKSAYRIEDRVSRLQSRTIIQNSINFNDGSFLVTSIDMFNDNITGNHALGLGLRYNF